MMFFTIRAGRRSLVEIVTPRSSAISSDSPRQPMPPVELPSAIVSPATRDGAQFEHRHCRRRCGRGNGTLTPGGEVAENFATHQAAANTPTPA